MGKDKDKCCHENEHTCCCGDNCECNDTNDKANEYLELAQRLKAEFENYKKRNAEVASQSFDNGVVTTIETLLPALDAFKQAKSNLKDESVIKGIDMILSQILNAFAKIGVSKIECVGKDFDPNYHNAVMVENDSEKQDNVVLEEFQEGFMYKDKVVRYSVVKINKH